MQILDYYEILKLPYSYKPFRLFSNYLAQAKIALNNKDYEKFTQIRQGYEVLRNEEATECYNRIYKKYILNHELNYPKRKEEEMIKVYQEREQAARYVAARVSKRKESYPLHLTKIILGFLFFDISRFDLIIITSGVWCISIGVIIMATFRSQINMIGGSFVVMFGVFFLWRNMKRYISY